MVEWFAHSAGSGVAEVGTKTLAVAPHPSPVWSSAPRQAHSYQCTPVHLHVPPASIRERRGLGSSAARVRLLPGEEDASHLH